MEFCLATTWQTASREAPLLQLPLAEELQTIIGSTQQTVSAHAAAAHAQELTAIMMCRLECCLGMDPVIKSDRLLLAAAAPAEEKKEEQTEFDVKLDGFDAAAKIKVIKEVRGVLPELGLKEAKELVSF